jgi:hypothetical protein
MTIGKIELRHLVPIVGDGAIGNPNIGEGRLIPVLILDCKNHPALHDLILIHADTPPGDAVVRWGRRMFDKKHVYLTLDFARPVATTASFCFDVSKQGGLVDWIINTRAVYLQPSASGAKVIEGLDQPKIVVEIPPETTLPGWEDIYRNSVSKTYRENGCTRAEAKEATDQHLARLRELSAMRMRPPHNVPIEA